jgi:hypothetical protein
LDCGQAEQAATAPALYYNLPMPQNMLLMGLAVLLGIGTGVLFGYISRKPDDSEAKGAEPTAPLVLREISGLVLVYTLGACAFILGYIGWWGGIEPPANHPPGLIGALRNPGLIAVLLSWLIGLGSYRLWRG